MSHPVSTSAPAMSKDDIIEVVIPVALIAFVLGAASAVGFSTAKKKLSERFDAAVEARVSAVLEARK